MQFVYVETKNTKDRALLMSTGEWKRLNKILTKKDDEKAAEEEIKRSRYERQTVSKAMAESWNTTTLVKNWQPEARYHFGD